MAQINCNGDCLNCAHRLNGEVSTSECASMYGFIHIQQSMRELRTLHTDIKGMHEQMMIALQSLAPSNIEPKEPNEFVCGSELLTPSSEIV